MLDQVWVFKKSGVVLWSKTLAPIRGVFLGGSIVNHLIRTVLLEERTGASQVCRQHRLMTFSAPPASWQVLNPLLLCPLELGCASQSAGSYREARAEVGLGE